MKLSHRRPVTVARDSGLTAPPAVGSGALLGIWVYDWETGNTIERCFIIVLLLLVVTALIFLGLILKCLIQEKSNHLDNVPSHRESQAYPHPPNPLLVVSGEFGRLGDYAVTSVSRSRNLQFGVAKNLDGLKCETSRTKGAQCDSERGDQFNAHNAKMPNEKS